MVLTRAQLRAKKAPNSNNKKNAAKTEVDLVAVVTGVSVKTDNEEALSAAEESDASSNHSESSDQEDSNDESSEDESSDDDDDLDALLNKAQKALTDGNMQEQDELKL